MKALHWDEIGGRAGERFELVFPDGTLPLTLIETQQLPHARREGGAFRLEFLGPVNPVLPQAIYRLVGEGLDEQVFLVAIGREAEGTRYEAIYT